MLVGREATFRSFWYPVCFEGELGADPVAASILGTDIVIWRSNDLTCAAVDRYPHRWAKLSLGEVLADGTLQCAYHSWQFGPDGQATHVPQLGADGHIPRGPALTSLPVASAYGLVWTSLSASPDRGIPDLPEWDDPDFRAIEIARTRFECSAPAVIDNNTDATHVVYVHRRSFGADQDPISTVPTVERTEFGLRIWGETPVANRPGDDGETVRMTDTEIWAPFIQVSRFHFPDGLTHILFKACCPRGDDTTEVFLSVIRSDTEIDSPAEDIISFERTIEAEDAHMLASLPAEFPLDPTLQSHTKYDRPRLELRRFYSDLVGSTEADG